MNTTDNEVRCKACRSLLAKIDVTGLTILRGGLQATIEGNFHVTLQCYLPHCRSVNILNFSKERCGIEFRAAR